MIKKIAVALMMLISVATLAQTPDKMLKSMASIEVSMLIRQKGIGISLGHSISRHWSAIGYAGTQVASMGEVNIEEITHKEEFSGAETKDPSPEYQFTIGCGLRYWASEVHERTFIELGMINYGKNRTDITAAIGYILEIWEGLSAEISTEMDLLQTWKEGLPCGKGICISLCFKF